MGAWIVRRRKEEKDLEDEYNDFQQDPEWYAMKMAAKMERENDKNKWFGDESTVAAICVATEPVESFEVPGQGTAKVGTSPKRRVRSEGAKEVLDLKGSWSGACRCCGFSTLNIESAEGEEVGISPVWQGCGNSVACEEDNSGRCSNSNDYAIRFVK